jgi:hypothetical protein
MGDHSNIVGTDWPPEESFQRRQQHTYLFTSTLTRGRSLKPSTSSVPAVTEATRPFRMQSKPGDPLMMGPDGTWIHPGAVIPVRGPGGAIDSDGDWPAYDPWTGLRTAGVLGGCMLLVLAYILYKTRCGGRAGRPRRRWTSKDRLFVEKYKRKVSQLLSRHLF